MTWKELLQSSRGRLVLLFCGATMLMMVFYMPHFYREIIGPKKGMLIDDPILALLNPLDWSLPIFTLLYLAVLQTLVFNVNKPQVLLLGVTTYCAINIFRMMTMYGLTLEPPIGMILLADPISSIAYPDKGFAKDLFFSGHISTMIVLALVDENKIAKVLKFAAAIVMALFLAWQHVHYTIDLAAAPVVTYLFFILTRNVLRFDTTGGKPTKTAKTR